MSRIFRGYTREELDREYDNIAKLPEPELLSYRKRWAEQSADARQRYDCALDVPFGASEGEKLDIFRSGRAGPAPVHVYVHGGYWHSNDKRDCSYVAHGFCGAGFVTFVINYSLAPKVTIADQVSECRAAIAWIWRQAAEYGGDPQQIHVTGHSAGGHLAAMLAATDFSSIDPAMPQQPLRSVTSLSGIYDLEPIRLCFLNDKVQLSPEDVPALSPVAQRPSGQVRLLAAIGDREGREYLRQLQDLTAAWRPHLGHFEQHVLAGHDHFSIRAELDDPDSDVMKLILTNAARPEESTPTN